MGGLTETILFQKLKKLFGEENIHAAPYASQDPDFTYIPVKEDTETVGWIGIRNARLTEEARQLLLILNEPSIPDAALEDTEHLLWQRVLQERMSEWAAAWQEQAYPEDEEYGLIYIIVQKRKESWNADLIEQFRDVVEGVLEDKTFLVSLAPDEFIWILPKYTALAQEIVPLCKGLVDTLIAELLLQTQFFIDEPIKMPTELKEYVPSQLRLIRACEQLNLRSNVIFVRDLLHIHLLKQCPAPELERYVQKVLGATLPDTEVLETIRVYFQENLNVSEAAKKLFIHRNSLQYRLERFLEKTGYDLKRFEHAVMVSIAIQALGMLNKE